MIPLKDDIPTRRFPIVTVSIITMNVLFFLYQLSWGAEGETLIYIFGSRPLLLTKTFFSQPIAFHPIYVTLITSMFMHAGFFHIMGNMLYLWIFGNNIEDSMGRFRFLIFYLLSGITAALAHIFISPSSDIPMVGASGAVSGVLGAYLILYPYAKVKTLITFGFFWQIVQVPALIVLGFWIILQMLNGFVTFSGRFEGGVAWFAHIGGFFFGLLTIKLFARYRYYYYRRNN